MSLIVKNNRVFFCCYTKKMLKNQNFVRVEIKQEYSSWKFYRTKFHETLFDKSNS